MKIGGFYGELMISWWDSNWNTRILREKHPELPAICGWAEWYLGIDPYPYLGMHFLKTWVRYSSFETCTHTHTHITGIVLVRFNPRDFPANTTGHEFILVNFPCNDHQNSTDKKWDKYILVDIECERCRCGLYITLMIKVYIDSKISNPTLLTRRLSWLDRMIHASQMHMAIDYHTPLSAYKQTSPSSPLPYLDSSPLRTPGREPSSPSSTLGCGHGDSSMFTQRNCCRQRGTSIDGWFVASKTGSQWRLAIWKHPW